MVTVFFEVLDNYSDEERVAQTDKYDCANCLCLETWDSALSTNVADPPLGPNVEWPPTHLFLL